MSYQPIYKLRDWIPTKYLVWAELCGNPNAISLLEKHRDRIQKEINWLRLCSNPNAVHLVIKYWGTIVKYVQTTNNTSALWTILLRNPGMKEIIHKHWKALPTYFERGGWANVWESLCKNPEAGSLLYKCRAELSNRNIIVYGNQALHDLGANPSAIPFIKSMGGEDFVRKCPGIHIIEGLCSNPNAVPLLKNYNLVHSMVHVSYFCELYSNPNAYSLLKEYWQHVYDAYAGTIVYPEVLAALCGNPCAVPLLEEYWNTLVVDMDEQEEACWGPLCANPGAIALLDKHWDSHLRSVLQSQSLLGYHLMNYLCRNPNAIPLLEKHMDEIKKCIMDWGELSANPGIFVLDLNAMREQARPFAEELAAKAFTPARVAAWEAAGFDVLDA